MSRHGILVKAYTAFRDHWDKDEEGYFYDLETVETVARGFDEVPIGDKPWLGVYAGTETFEYLPSHQIKSTLELIVLLHLSITDDHSRIRHLDYGITSIIKTLRQSILCEAGAIATNLMSVETDEGDPGAMDAGTLIARFNVTYMRTDPL